MKFVDEKKERIKLEKRLSKYKIWFTLFIVIILIMVGIISLMSNMLVESRGMTSYYYNKYNYINDNRSCSPISITIAEDRQEFKDTIINLNESLNKCNIIKNHCYKQESSVFERYEEFTDSYFQLRMYEQDLKYNLRLCENNITKEDYYLWY